LRLYAWTMARLALLGTLVLALAGCAGGGDDEARERATTASRETTTAPPPSPPQEPPLPPPPSGPLRLETVVSGLEAPVHAAAAPGEPERLYVVERVGRIRVVENGRLRPEPFLDIRPSVVSGGEQGLLSVAFHPEYEVNGRLYVAFTSVDGQNTVVELRANDARTAVNLGSARELLAVDDPYVNHNGGQLAFGPDGLLYHGTGDGGAGGDPENRAQDLGDRLGKLLRLDVDDPNGNWQVVAYGLRNPWRFSFDRETGDLLLADVGQGAQEEIDFLPWPLAGLVNFGWDVFEGEVRYEDKDPNPAGRLVGPIHVYGRNAGCSVTGGFVYRGAALPQAHGRYFFGDYCSGTVWSLRASARGARDVRRERFIVEGLSSFGEDAAGELLFVSLGGTLYRLTA
jgi:glucose/arabinose dehydrogenase